jgi:hypothetical protein
MPELVYDGMFRILPVLLEGFASMEELKAAYIQYP